MSNDRITVDPRRMGGLPCIRDTRVTVSAVLGQLAAGRSMDQFLEDYPYLQRADVLAALEFAAAAVQERELRESNGGDLERIAEFYDTHDLSATMAEGRVVTEPPAGEPMDVVSVRLPGTVMDTAREVAVRRRMEVRELLREWIEQAAS